MNPTRKICRQFQYGTIDEKCLNLFKIRFINGSHNYLNFSFHMKNTDINVMQQMALIITSKCSDFLKFQLSIKLQ